MVAKHEGLEKEFEAVTTPLLTNRTLKLCTVAYTAAACSCLLMSDTKSLLLVPLLLLSNQRKFNRFADGRHRATLQYKKQNEQVGSGG